MSIHQHRVLYDKVCPVCGQPFKGFKNKVVCSTTCRQRKRREELKK